MKKAVTLILASALLISLNACKSEESKSLSNSETETTVSSTVDTTEIDNSAIKSETIGQTLLNDFRTRLESDPSVSAEELVDGILSNSIIEFDGAQIPVENGFLTGFGNAEITGFKEGVMFSPMIGTIPFVGYVFVLDNDSDAESFVQTLKDNADLRWNICTEADEMVVDHVGNTIFFLMCPSSFE